MILIVSKEKLDASTDDVIDWLHYYSKSFKRINGDSVYAGDGFFAAIENVGKSEVKVKGVDLDETYTIGWFRRWSDREYLDKISAFDQFENLQFQALYDVIRSDELTFREFVLSNLKVHKWLTSLDTSDCNKLIVLNEAKKCGLNIPHTLITGKKTDVALFLEKHGRIITKDISRTFFVFGDQQTVSSYATELTPQNLEVLPDQFMPSMFQELISKQYEIRTFFLDKKCYSMAIFSQLDAQTQVDFRKYNLDKPNRTVPYKLPDAVEQKLMLVMDELGLTTGSIDLIKSKAGGYIFLEINPVGQFGMTSFPCNYRLEKIIAKYLSEIDHE